MTTPTTINDIDEQLTQIRKQLTEAANTLEPLLNCDLTDHSTLNHTLHRIQSLIDIALRYLQKQLDRGVRQPQTRTKNPQP